MNKKKINIVTMGCSKNLVDSEVLLSQLKENSFKISHNSNDTDFDAVIINTCGFIHDAKEESVNMILDYVDAKADKKIDKLYVMGCLSERYKSDLQNEISEVDRFFGKFDIRAITQELNVTFYPEKIYQRTITTPSHFAYLKIAEGCNRTCAFCAIPKITGQYQSKPIEDLVKEAQYLARNGVKELLLIAQDLSYYGIDFCGKNQLAELIEALSEIEGIKWIRLHYLYPTKFPFDILPLMKNNPKVCKYLDLPFQHISDSVLKNMRRNVNKKASIDLLNRIRTEVPGVAIRTTMLVGFPGETEEDFNELKEFVAEAQFERLGVFTYSKEEGTFAARKLKDNIPETVKLQRANEIMELQQGISRKINVTRIGQKLAAIIDRKEGEFYIGRTEFDSPEVDGEVIIESRNLTIGKIYLVVITGADDYDLMGKVE